MVKKTWWVVPVGVLLGGAALAAEKNAQGQAAEQLNGTEWQIELTPMSGEHPARPLNDTVRFGQGTITSERLSTDGFVSSNYTLTVGDDEVPVWETMQTSEREGVAFWQGELHGQSMRGILSQHPLEGSALDYSFVGSSVSAAAQQPEASPPTPAVAQAESALPQEQAPQPPAATPSSKNTKKGWFGR